MIPLIEPDITGGQVVVTRFECGTLRKLFWILAMHARVKIDVRRQSTGFVGVKALIDWRRRTVYSITLWRDLDSVYSMGNVPRHVSAARVPRVMGVETTCGIFCYVGDWRRVMFRSPSPPRSPLHSAPREP